jgi:hypothetical protein
MEGFDVATSDDERWGHVVGESGENLIVEHGHLRKHKYALPRTFTHVDENARLVRTTLSKDLLANSPKLDDDGVDDDQIAAYYGLSEVEWLEDGPEVSADQQAL